MYVVMKPLSFKFDRLQPGSTHQEAFYNLTYNKAIRTVKKTYPRLKFFGIYFYTVRFLRLN